MPDDTESAPAPRSQPYMLGDETDFVFVDGKGNAPEDDDDAPSTAALVTRARRLIAAAEAEQPLDADRYGALEAEVELVCLEADDPDDVRSAVASELAALKPGEGSPCPPTPRSPPRATRC
jgi:hypothetical protein